MMLYVNDKSCDGCGRCLAACPTGAIHLVDDVALIDQAECSRCEACQGACPRGAILTLNEPNEAGVRPIEISHSGSMQAPSPAPLASPQVALRPLVGVALAFIGRRVLPQVAEAVLRMLAQRRTESVASVENGRQVATPRADRPMGGRRRTHRRRGDPEI